MMHHTTQRGFKDCPGFLNSMRTVGAQKRAEMLHHPCILEGPQQRERNQNSKPTPGVTMMHHATKRGFKDCPGFLNRTGRLGPKRGRKCYITPAFSGVLNKGNKVGSQNLCRGSP